MPGKGKEPLGLHFLHDGLPFEVLVARMSNYDRATPDLLQMVHPVSRETNRQTHDNPSAHARAARAAL